MTDIRGFEKSRVVRAKRQKVKRDEKGNILDNNPYFVDISSS